ncbi:unnamed protein product [Bursaphelenchus okinawaensis]|uniref:Deoxyribonuclease TATDN1 n=1 Tax=Bursaphelenchus okinawaensis TaxID=465554 RepID=A0A811LGB9_9BILA|nr:unnamed protein product [Bursaphelenchus okinawaensis]CAG9122330.1 unnamed protein product [Bursaphelenchus okinawaensis]
MSYNLVDIGANLTHPSYKEDLAEVIKRAKQAGLSKIMVTGTCLESVESAYKLSNEYNGYLYFTSGVHPHDAKDWKVETGTKITEYSQKPNCVAIGECGLDFNRNFSPQEVQKTVFEEQVKIACQLQKAMFIHERDAFDDLNLILDKYETDLPPIVIHCFTGTAEQAIKYIEKGYYIGLTGYLWKDRSENGIRCALRSGNLPIDKLLLETDAPYMFCKVDDKKVPLEVREKLTEKAKSLHKFCNFKRNEPCGLASSCEMIAAFANVSPEELANVTTSNAKRIYMLE